MTDIVASPPAPPTRLGMPTRVLSWVALVVLAGGVLVAIAAARLALDPPAPGTAFAIALFLALALVADLKPIPLDEIHNNGVSLAFVFIVAAQLLFGWEAGVLIAAVSILVAEGAERRPRVRALFNGGTYALAALASAVPGLVVGHAASADPARLTIYSFAGGALFVFTNVALVSQAVALSTSSPLAKVLRTNFRQAAGAFTVMAFIAALAANLWVLEPSLIGLLAGPLFTVTLYQRSALSSRIARRDALTDSLTGVGNHRSYQQALQDEIERRSAGAEPLTLCLLDVDDFKSINDRFGHPLGDEVLVAFAAALGTVPNGTPFRLGGDEFAVLVDGDDIAASALMEAFRGQLAAATYPHGQPLTVSVGIASFPEHATDPEDLQRDADRALYWSKRHGKDQTFVYSPSVTFVASSKELGREAERQARLRAAENLVRIVDTKDSATGGHSLLVSELCERIGAELGIEGERLQRLKLAGLLHDLGKVGIPDSILQKPSALTPEEYAVMQRHSELGYSLLEGLDIDPVDLWILHHHEHWDGSGYPGGLVADEIPPESRIILVADAFEAMTADRIYRKARSREAALEELRDKAGTQFDPVAVDALRSVLERAHSAAWLAGATA